MRGIIFCAILVLLNGCLPKGAFQPARHDAEYWQKKNERYDFNAVLEDMKKCGWLPPKDNLDENGKVRMELYSRVKQCMLNNGYVYRAPK